MAEKNELAHVVERVVTQVLQGHLPQLREELVRRGRAQAELFSTERYTQRVAALYYQLR